MKRYVTRAWLSPAISDDGFKPVRRETITVLEANEQPRATGLFDHHGNELFAVNDKLPIRFVR